MKIGFIAAPGAGKTKIARKTINLLKKRGESDWVLVDGYVDKYREDTGIPFGHPSTFAQNLSLITKRWVDEATAVHKGKSTITCGTIYDSIFYTSVAMMFTPETEQQILAQQSYNQIVMQALGALERLTYDYDALFYLPYSDTLVKEKEGTWEAVVNAKLPELLEGTNKKAIALDQKTEKAKAEMVIEAVDKINEFYKLIAEANRSAPEADEPTA